jgi:two-component system sensor histidine kinase BarA
VTDSAGKAIGNGALRRESVLQRRTSLSDFLDLPTFTDLLKGFVELYKIGVKVFDESGTKLADFRVGNGDFCSYVFSFADGRGRCTATVARVKEGPLATVQGARAPEVQEAETPSSIIAVPCFTGLRYLVMPIHWEGDLLGRIIFGPFTPDDLAELPSTLTEIGKGFDPANAEALMSKIRRASEGTVAKVMTHFAQLVETLIAAGQKTYLTSQLHIEATLETNRELEDQNRRLEAMNARLKELDRLKSSFLATVSHELRTPLTSIMGYSEMLAQGLAGPMNDEQSEYLQTILDKSETLLKLISSILDISQIEAGKVRLTFEPVDVAEVIRSSLSFVAPQAQKKGILLQVRVPERHTRATADREKLRQTVVNLLANAVKFTAEGGTVSVALSEIAFQPELNGEGYRILVEDTGVGIPAEYHSKIFQSFYQIDSSSTREFGGAGLGLAIVKSFVEGHGGRVSVESAVGQGSRFTAVLPTVPPAPRTLEIPPPAKAGSDKNRF